MQKDYTIVDKEPKENWIRIGKKGWNINTYNIDQSQ